MQIVLVGVNNLCHSAGRICTQQKKAQPSRITPFL